jgi:hypothetical protein
MAVRPSSKLAVNALKAGWLAKKSDQNAASPCAGK